MLREHIKAKSQFVFHLIVVIRLKVGLIVMFTPSMATMFCPFISYDKAGYDGVWFCKFGVTITLILRYGI